MSDHTRALAWLAAALFAVSGLGQVFIAPLYEETAWKLVVPVLGSTDFVAAYAIWRNAPTFKAWARPYAIGSLCIAVPFWGESQHFYGNLATPMLVAETSLIVACLVLLMLTFARGFLAPAQQAQTAAADAASRRG